MKPEDLLNKPLKFIIQTNIEKNKLDFSQTTDDFFEELKKFREENNSYMEYLKIGVNAKNAVTVVINLNNLSEIIDLISAEEKKIGFKELKLKKLLPKLKDMAAPSDFNAINVNSKVEKFFHNFVDKNLAPAVVVIDDEKHLVGKVTVTYFQEKLKSLE